MQSRFTISLQNVRFRAYHGLYPEERQSGNDFIVNLQVSYLPKKSLITNLNDTIDYARLFAIINTIMQEPVDLLETLVQKMADTVHTDFPQIIEITASVEKLNPPIDKFQGSTVVRLQQNY